MGDDLFHLIRYNYNSFLKELRIETPNRPTINLGNQENYNSFLKELRIETFPCSPCPAGLLPYYNSFLKELRIETFAGNKEFRHSRSLQFLS